MRLKAVLSAKACQFFEVYPGQLARHLDLPKQEYKKDKVHLSNLTAHLIQCFSIELAKIPENWHQFDALLAYISGLRFARKEHLSIGENSEGLIIV